jgi:hypothetical protein
MFLPGVSWFSEVEAEGRLISREREAWGQAAKIKNRQAPSPLAVLSQNGTRIFQSLLPLARRQLASRTLLLF